MTESQAAPPGEKALDGRRQRTVDSRARIVQAVLELTAEGHVGVGAEMVAERAGVGLRTVFRHFKDMESLYREISLIMAERLREMASRPFAATAWQDRLQELVQRRTTIFEAITPFKRAEAAQRHRSKVLEEDISQMNAVLREVLGGVVPKAVQQDKSLFEALDVAMSFEAWERIRRDQRLSLEEGRAVLRTATERLLAGYPKD